MSGVLFLLDVPTPYRTPVLDAMSARGLDLGALYFVAQDVKRGWGDVRLGHPARTVPAGALRSCLAVVKEVRAPGVRVFCCFGYNRPAAVAGLLAARLRGIPVVTQSDSNWQWERRRPAARRRLKGRFLRVLFGRDARVWTVGAENARYWREMGLANQHHIPYGVPRPPIGSPDQGLEFRRRHRLGRGPVVLFVGALTQRKGLDTLLAAFTSLPDPDARLVVVGRGVLAGQLADVAAADRRVVACGALDYAALGPAYAAADLFVLPSRREPWGFVVQEAQANGLPVVVSDMVGCGTDLVGAETGFVFPAGDVSALRAVLRRALTGRSRRLPPRDPFDASQEMIRDLERLGAVPSGQRQPAP
jgi:glycosyltransferase involved in cell wall biosynthesis